MVENDRALLRGLVLLLSAEGYRTRGFSAPERALEEGLTNPPRVIITDYAMPRVDGVELAKTLRSHLGPSTPRLFLVTGSRLRRVELTHFDHVLQKPFAFADMVKLVERALARPRHESHQRLRRVGVMTRRTGGEER